MSLHQARDGYWLVALVLVCHVLEGRRIPLLLDGLVVRVHRLIVDLRPHPVHASRHLAQSVADHVAGRCTGIIMFEIRRGRLLNLIGHFRSRCCVIISVSSLLMTILVLSPLPTLVLILMDLGLQIDVFQLQFCVSTREMVDELFVVQVLKLDGVDYLVEHFNRLFEVVFYTSQLLLVPDVEELSLLFTAGDAKVLAGISGGL